MRSTLLLLLTLLSLFSFSQDEQCASMLAFEKEAMRNPEFLERVMENEMKIQKFLKNKANQPLSEEVLTIPIVVHVMHLGEDVGTGSNISDDQIMSAITKMNSDFAEAGGVNTNIQFALAKLDPNCNPTTGIVRYNASSNADYVNDGISTSGPGADEVVVKAMSKWPNTDYYNIWVVTEINGNNGGFGTQGFAYFPGASADVDGTIVMHTAFGTMGTVANYTNENGIIVHELGHAFNLYHTFEGDRDEEDEEICPVEENGCGRGVGDCCEDTEPHKRSNSDCPTGINECTGEEFVSGPNNYMDYSSQTCQSKFTQDQKERMRAAIITSRASLLTSRALSSSAATFTDGAAPSCQPATQALGLSDFYAGVRSLTFAGKVFQSGYASQDGGYVDNTTNCLSTMEVIKGQTYDLEVEGLVNTNYVRVWIDYNNDGAFAANEMIEEETVAANGTTSASITIPTSDVEFETNLRLRVALDITNYIGACDQPLYGQIEDYAVVIKHAEDEEDPIDAPIASFSTSFPTRCSGSELSFYDGSIGQIDSWSWEISNGETTYTSTEQNPDIVMDVAGVYTVTLTVTNEGGSDSETKVDEITINETPLVDVSVTEISCVDAADAQIAFNSPGSDTPYEYSVMIMQMDLTNESVFTNLSPGVYYPSVNGANGCQAFGDEIVIDFAEEVSPGYEVFDICEGDSILVFGEYVKDAGLYEETFQTLNGCDSLHEVEIYVKQAPSLSYSITGLVCRDVNEGEISFDNPGVVAPYTYSIVEGEESSEASFTGLSAGTYYPKVTSVNGCSVEGDAIVIENPEVIQDGYLLHEICSGDSVEVFGDYVFDEGTFTEVYQTAAGCDSNYTIEVLYKVLEVYFEEETATISINDGVQTIPDGFPAGGYYSGIGVDGGEFNPAIAGEGTHEIVYTYVDEENCEGSALFTYVVEGAAVGINDLSEIAQVYPNPSSGMLVVHSKQNIESFSLYDVTGKLVFSETGMNVQQLNYDWTSLNQGFYVVEVLNQKQEMIRIKWTKE